MLGGVIIVFFVSLVGSIIVNALMLLKLSRRRSGRKIVIPEVLVFLLSGVMEGDYLDLLGKARITPTGFDKLLYRCQKGMLWVTVGSAVLFLLLLFVDG